MEGSALAQLQNNTLRQAIPLLTVLHVIGESIKAEQQLYSIKVAIVTEPVQGSSAL